MKCSYLVYVYLPVYCKLSLSYVEHITQVLADYQLKQAYYSQEY